MNTPFRHCIFSFFIAFIAISTLRSNIVINEINYNSADSLFPKDWVELYNNSENAIELENWIFKDDNDEHEFVIPQYTLSANGYLVICDSLNAFSFLFPEVTNVIGDFDFKLRNDGELIRLFDNSNILIDSLRYNDVDPWPIEADGSGATLELKNPNLDNELAENWNASENFGTPGVQNSTFIYVEQDCNGVWGGTAELDECGVCDGDNSTCLDCAGTPNGTSWVNPCDDCVEANDTSCIQGCDGLWSNDGSFLENDECGVCGGDNSTCIDCEGIPNGDSVEDMCGVCDSDNSNDCIQDCNGEWGGIAELDECNVCGGDNSTCTDCNGEVNGDAMIDGCGNCVGVNVGEGECLKDCAGIPNGTSWINPCEECVEESDTSCIQGCDGLWSNDGSYLENDECGVCGGDNSTCSDCEDVPNGDSVEDMCGICDSDSSNDCVQDCNGEWGGIAELDECNVCGGDNSTCTGCMDEDACNYTANLLFSDDSCEYPNENYDCFGNCIVVIDCSDVCGGMDVTCLSNNELLPVSVGITSIYPNPFNPVVNIEYSIKTTSNVKVSIINIYGSKITQLENMIKPIGNYRAQWNGSGVPSGVYFVQLETNGRVEIAKVLLLK